MKKDYKSFLKIMKNLDITNWDDIKNLEKMCYEYLQDKLKVDRLEKRVYLISYMIAENKNNATFYRKTIEINNIPIDQYDLLNENLLNIEKLLTREYKKNATIIAWARQMEGK